MTVETQPIFKLISNFINQYPLNHLDIEDDLVFFERNPYDRHNREYTLNEVKKICGIAGFDVIHSKFFNYRKATDNNIKFRIYNLLGFIYKSDNILVVCKKR